MESENLDPKKNTLDKQGKLRFDYLFSYWLFVWFLIYYFTINVKGSRIANIIQKYFNPLLALYIALIENILTLFYLLLVRPEIVLIVKYFIMLFFVKILPIYLIKHKKIHFYNDTLVIIVIFSCYNIYLWLNDTNLHEIYKRTISAISSGEKITPMFFLLNKLFNI